MAEDIDITALLADIPQRGIALGASAAPVTLQYFGDLQCPYCARFSLGPLPEIIEKWVRGGELLIEYRAIETATADPDVFVAQQVAVLAAGNQDKAWHFIEIFAAEQGQENSGYVTEDYLERIARGIAGLDVARWIDDRGNPELAEAIAADSRAAESAGVSGTPAFLIGKTGGEMAHLAPTGPSGFDAAIKDLLE